MRAFCRSLSWGALLVWSMAHSAELTPAELALKAQAQEGLRQIDVDHRALKARLHTAEQACLKRFVSAPCLEDLRLESAQETRIFDLARESLQQTIRRLEAGARQRSRALRVEDSHAQ